MSVSIKCNECGGQKYATIGANTYRCEYCGATFSASTAEGGIKMPPPPTSSGITIEGALEQLSNFISSTIKI